MKTKGSRIGWLIAGLALAVIFAPHSSWVLAQIRDLKVGPAPGETAPVAPAWLYVIGINDYMYVQKLTTAVADAQAVRDVLITRYNFDRSHLLERYDREATRAQIIDDFYLLAQKVGPEDSLFVYFAGHGWEDKNINQGYWVPVDGQAGKVSTFVSNADIRAALAGIPAKHTWLVSDSCFSGSLLADRALPDKIDERYYRDKYRLKSRQILTSGGKEPVADQSGNRDCQNHSVFACYFIKFLRNNQNSYLTPSEVFAYVAPVVSNNSGQTPVLGPLRNSGDELGEFVLIQRAGGLPANSSPTPAPGPAYTGADTSSLEAAEKRARERDEAEKRRQQQLEADRKKYFADLEAFYQKLLNLDKQTTLSPAEKVSLWQDFLVKFPENHSTFGPNPRAQYARERIVYWQRQGEKPGRLDSNAQDTPAGMVKIRAGCFQMGCVPGDNQCEVDENPRHEVCLDSIFMDAHEVTNKEYEECVAAGKCPKAHYHDGSCFFFIGSEWKQGANPNPEFEKTDHPVVCVGWEEARSYCAWSGKRLPTEAEWEYAARAGTNTIYYWGSQFDGLYAWGLENSGQKTHAVGTSSPNPWGLYDMSGNVWEWVADWYDPIYYGKTPRDNPAGPGSGTYRILRGGSWDYSSSFLRLSNRLADELEGRGSGNAGFRCSR